MASITSTRQAKLVLASVATVFDRSTRTELIDKIATALDVAFDEGIESQKAMEFINRVRSQLPAPDPKGA